mmetsp:Transcript_56625/g.104819  ORF Transcript_56625/g.104819 Transcript_56625/m.104819 type:complete len:249 (-) Transcript_56625:73-819(-)
MRASIASHLQDWVAWVCSSQSLLVSASEIEVINGSMLTFEAVIREELLYEFNSCGLAAALRCGEAHYNSLAFSANLCLRGRHKLPHPEVHGQIQVIDPNGDAWLQLRWASLLQATLTNQACCQAQSVPHPFSWLWGVHQFVPKGPSSDEGHHLAQVIKAALLFRFRLLFHRPAKDLGQPGGGVRRHRGLRQLVQLLPINVGMRRAPRGLGVIDALWHHSHCERLHIPIDVCGKRFNHVVLLAQHPLLA